MADARQNRPAGFLILRINCHGFHAGNATVNSSNLHQPRGVDFWSSTFNFELLTFHFLNFIPSPNTTPSLAPIPISPLSATPTLALAPLPSGTLPTLPWPRLLPPPSCFWPCGGGAGARFTAAKRPHLRTRRNTTRALARRPALPTSSAARKRRSRFPTSGAMRGRNREPNRADREVHSTTPNRDSTPGCRFPRRR